MTHTGFLRFFLTALIFCTLLTALQFSQCVHEGKCFLAEDFVLFHHAASEAAARHPEGIYDQTRFESWKQGKADSFHPFLYPPYSLPLLYPLSLFALPTSFVLWFTLHLALLGIAMRTAYVRRLFADSATPSTRPYAIFAIVFLPFACFSLYAGQASILFAALFILMLGWRKHHPIRAGLALAVLLCKPHLAVLLPLLLLYEKNGRALLATAAGLFVLTTLSATLWGVDLWQHYRELLGASWQIVSSAPDKYMTVAASPYMALRMLGLGSAAAMTTQYALSLLVVIAVWIKLKETLQESQIILLITTAALLISPYGFIYDSVMLALPCTLLFCYMASGTATPLERLSAMAIAFIPIIAVKCHAMHIPYTAISISLAFLAALRTTQKRIHP